MPNWTYNVVTITCPEGTKDKIKEALAGTDARFDFNRLVPMPEHSDDFQAEGNLAHDKIHTGKPRTKDNNWYDWSCEHWGTKWSACDINLDESIDDELTYRFDTAWDAPRPIVTKLRERMKEYGAQVDWSATHEFEEDTEEL
jgi:hypothetical protein